MTAQSQSILLDGVVGWQATTQALSTGGELSLSVDSLPGPAKDFGKLGESALGCPGALAADPCAPALYWVEDRSNRIFRAPLPELNRTEILPGIGPSGKAPRKLAQARGLALFRDGAIAVSDTRNRRVQIFSPPPYSLVAVIEGFSAPWAIAADECGNLYVADRGRGKVEKYYRDGTLRATLLEDLEKPTALARAQSGAIAVLEKAAITILSGSNQTRIDAPPGATALAFDDQLALYAGTSEGLIFKYVPDPAAATFSYRSAGESALGMEGGVRLMLWTRVFGLLIAGYERCRSNAELWRSIPGADFVRSGALLTEPLDSGIEECVWHNVHVDADIPEGCAIEVAMQTSERNTWKQLGAPFEPGRTLILGSGSNECLVQAPAGRFLRLQLRLRAHGGRSPLLRSIRLRFPRESYLKYLPAVFQEDIESRSFLDRFLSIFQTSFDAFDRQIDNMSALFDPLATPDKLFVWLASWLALPLNPHWTDQQRREALKNAWRLYKLRGTPEGLRQLIKVYTDVDATVVEHFRMRPLMILGRNQGRRVGRSTFLWSRDFYARLQVGAYARLGYFRLISSPEPAMEPLAWGAHRFSVFFLARASSADSTLKRVKQVVEREKPAHTEAVYCPVFPRMRVGVQSTVGVDTRLGVIDPMVLRRVATLGYDSVLGCSRQEQSVRASGASVQPRAGLSSKLL